MTHMLTDDIQIRDPFILKHDNQYYLFGSTDKDIWKSDGRGFDAYISRDLTNWQGPIPAFRPPEGFWGTKNFWAPEVYRHEDAFYMFASFMSEAVNRGTAVLKAENPAGPFLPWSDGAVTPRDWMCLDGTFYVDEQNAPWIIFCHEWVQVGDGTICAARMSGDLSRIVSDPVVLFASSGASWSAEAFSPSNNKRGYVTDGCNMYRMKNGRLLMLWSCVGTDGYCIGYAVSESGNILGPWRQAQKPLFARDGGHGMIFRAYDGRLLLAIHTPNKTPYERAVFIEIEETGDGISLKQLYSRLT